MTKAIGVTIYHPGADPGAVRDVAATMAASAAAAPGYRDAYRTVSNQDVLDLATAVVFDDEKQLHRWLDGPDRARLLADGARQGLHRKTADLVIADGVDPPTGVVMFWHTVAQGRDEEFISAQADIVKLSATFPGYEGATLVQPGRSGDQWLSILRFRTDRQLDAWMTSAERQAALPELRSHLAADFSTVAHSTPFGSIMRVKDGTTRVTPSWKTAMLVLLALYPTVMTLSRFVGPTLDELGAEPWLAMWLSEILSVGLLTWLLMPNVTKWFRRWLDPVDGAGVRISLIGAGIVVLGYVLTLALFGSVTWLQFWDYQD